MHTKTGFISFSGSLISSASTAVQNLKGKKSNLFQRHIATRAIILATFPCNVVTSVLDIIVMVGALIGRAVTPKSSPYYERFKTSLKEAADNVAMIPILPIALALQLIYGNI